MSYILDALKKSEQERGHGNIPSVQTVHTSSLNYSNKKSYWPYILITAVILNLAAIILYFYLDKEKSDIKIQQDSPVSDQLNTQAPTETRTPVSLRTANDIGQQTDIISAKTDTPVQEQDPGHEAIAEESIETVSTSSDKRSNTDIPAAYEQPVINESSPSQSESSMIIDFYDLPQSIKMQIPEITVSAHVYSDNPLQRSIVINNNFMEEGERVLDDLVLKEITKSGAIMDFQGTLFRYEIVSGWQ
jgi:general secretion pathway protein B